MEHFIRHNNNNLNNTIATEAQIPLDDPTTMNLSPQEVEWATDIKVAVESSDNLTNLTDFEYVQYALVYPTSDLHNNNHDDDDDTAARRESLLQKVLHVVSHMQSFREEYNIQDTVEEGINVITAFSRNHPGLWLSILYLPLSGNCIHINDWAAYFPKENVLDKGESGIRLFIKCFYYRFQCLNPTCLAIRLGFSTLVECEGATSNNYDFGFHQRLWMEFISKYPTRHKEIYLINNPMFINVAIGLFKRIMPRNLVKAFHLGYQVSGLNDGERLDILFKVPSAEVGRQMMVQQAHTLLQVRYHHQSTFTLVPALGGEAGMEE